VVCGHALRPSRTPRIRTAAGPADRELCREDNGTIVGGRAGGRPRRRSLGEGRACFMASGIMTASGSDDGPDGRGWPALMEV